LVTTLKAHQPDVSNLLRGKLARISITKLIQFAGRLNLEARVKLTSPKLAKPVSSVKVSTTKSAKSRRELVST
jgi:hypothetical protein